MRKSLKQVILTLAVVTVLTAATTSRAAIVLTNGSFETTGTQYNAVLGGLKDSTGWTNLSGLNLQASSMLAGQEGTSAAGATGSRMLRLASDNPDPTNTGIITQNLGTMNAGETYTFKADALGGGGVINWGATASFVNQGVSNPSTVFATQTISGVTSGQVTTNAFNFSYTALPADNGNPLFILLRASPSGSGQSRRGGIDNARITILPEPTSLGLLGLGSMILLRRKTNQ